MLIASKLTKINFGSSCGYCNDTPFEKKTSNIEFINSLFTWMTFFRF